MRVRILVVAADLPSVVCSISFDQPFQDSRLEDRHIGKHRRFTGFSDDALVEALRPLLRAGS